MTLKVSLAKITSNKAAISMISRCLSQVVKSYNQPKLYSLKRHLDRS